MKISPQMLSVLLDVPKADARLKIIYALQKKKKAVDFTILSSEERDTAIEKCGKDPLIDIKDMSDHMGFDLQVYVDDIKNNYFVRSQTRGYILNYPEKKMVLNKKKEYPKSISIPAWLKCFITLETQAEIIEAWREKYTYYTKEFNVQFK